MGPASYQTEYYGDAFDASDRSKESIVGHQYDQCVFTNCRFTETVFKACAFQDCEFINCDLSLMKVADSVFSNNLIRDSKAVGINWAAIRVPGVKVHNPVEFTGSQINYSVFQGLDLRKVRMIDCQARDVSFEEADLSGANLGQSDFANAVFRRTNLEKADFTGAVNYGIDIRNNRVAGARFSLPEAVSLLAHLDIELVDGYGD